MLALFIPALLLAQTPVPDTGGTPVPLDIQQQTALRCSMAIAMAAQQQRAGTPADPSWPDLRERGREFFVRSLAQLMEDTGLTREGLVAQARPEVEALRQAGQLAQVVPACLLLLDASGL
ncbi:MAG: hypothetical protein WC889_01255 [Myxococcota bacterium]|jgi:hypothetical protein